jgi:hypothetical protein
MTMVRSLLLTTALSVILVGLVNSLGVGPAWAGSAHGRPETAFLAAAPVPAPTPVLALGSGPGRLGGNGWYHSTLAPYAVVTHWPGHPEVWSDGCWDQFEHGWRVMEIEAARGVAGATTAQAVQELVDYLRTTRVMEAHVLGPVGIGGQQVPVFLTRYRGDWMARLAFVADGWLWRLSLNTDGWHLDADLHDFLASVRSFQLDPRG